MKKVIPTFAGMTEKRGPLFVRRDRDQVDGEEQGRAAEDRAPAIIAVSEIIGDRELETVADAHQRHALLPAPDQARRREGRRLVAGDRGVELGAVDEAADIVDGDRVGRGGMRAVRSAAELAVAKAAQGAVP